MKSSILPAQKIIKVIIADDQLTIRKNLELQLAKAKDIEVVGLADDGIEALKKIAELTPDVIIIDLEMPRMDGITAIKEICDHFSQTKALVFSTHEEREYINRAIVAGAKGYLLKNTPPQDLITAIRNVSQGYFQLGVGLLDKMSVAKSQVSLKSNHISPQTALYKKEISNLESILNSKMSSLIEFKTNDNYNKISNLLTRRLDLIVAEQARNNTRFKQIELRLYFILCWQVILTLVLLLNI